MNRNKILLAIMTLALVSLACTININLPSVQDKTGPTVTEDVLVPYLEGTGVTADVNMSFGAGEFSLKPGAENALISGTATYNVADLKPEVSVDSNNVTVKQGNVKLGGIPFISQDVINRWDLSLGNRPMSLVIQAGAYEGTYEFGGLSIHKLAITDGAAKVNLSFSQPNQVDMTSLDYTTGASDVSLTGLGNASPATLSFKGGAGSYTLNFGGTLTKDMTVRLEAGVSTVTLIIPKGVAATLSNEGNLITVNTSGDWQQSGSTYQHPGSGYTITIQSTLGAGTLRLETGN